MTTTIRIGLVGDRDDTVTAHRAIVAALELTAAELEVRIEPTWLPTDRIMNDGSLDTYDALWCVPASPYRSTDGALHAIRIAREEGIPFLGTCGGFQHAVLEYARTVHGWTEAAHAELSPDALLHVITPLACSLVEAHGTVHFVQGTRTHAAYGSACAQEGYHCSYGLNPLVRAAILTGALTMSAESDDGEVRAVELADHPFFVATLFQPERAALEQRVPPLVAALVRSAIAR